MPTIIPTSNRIQHLKLRSLLSNFVQNVAKKGVVMMKTSVEIVGSNWYDDNKDSIDTDSSK